MTLHISFIFDKDYRISGEVEMYKRTHKVFGHDNYIHNLLLSSSLGAHTPNKTFQSLTLPPSDHPKHMYMSSVKHY